MSKLSALFVLSCLLALAVALPEARLQQRQLRQQQLQHPYLFFSVPRGRANGGAVVQGFEIMEDLDDVENDDDDNDDDVSGSKMPLRRLQHNFDDDADDDDDDEMMINDDDDDDDIDQLPVKRGFARSGHIVLLNNDDVDEQDDDDADVADDDDDDDDAEDAQLPVLLAKPSLARKSSGINGQQLLKNAKPTPMMVARDQAGAIMVPDGIIEIEGQSVVDEKTGKAALLVPRAALDAIPDGAVVALMERSASDSSVGEERANRVIVRRRKNGGRRNIRRRLRRGGRPVRRRVGGRRRGGKRRNVRVIRAGGNRRRGGQRRRVVYRG